jgi:hypothetical protein
MRPRPPVRRFAASSVALLIAVSALVVASGMPASAQAVPPLILENTAEGGTDGTVVTIENSGGASGQAWDIIRPTAATNPNRFVYRSANALKGNMSYDLTTEGTGQALLAWWFWANNGTIEQPIVYTRFYARFPTAPAGNVRIYRLREPGGHDVLSLQVVASTRKLRLFNSDKTVVWVSQSAVPVNATFRVEVYWDWQARRAEVRLYLGDPDAAVNSFTESSGSVTSNFGARDIDEAAYGNPLSTADFGTLLLDDIGFSNQGWMGPTTTSPPPPPPPPPPSEIVGANTAEGGSNGTAVTTANSGGASGTAWDFVTRATNTNRFVYRSTGALKGSRSYELATAGTGQAYLAWWFNAGTGRGDQPVVYTRLYGRFPSLSGNVRLLRLRDPTGSELLSVFIPGNTKRFQLRNAANQVVWTSTNPVPANATFRVEVRWDRTAGQAEVRLFLTNPDAAVNSFTESSGTVSGWINRNVAEAAYGAAGSASNFGTLLLDDIGFSNQGWMGPTT